MSLPLLKRIFSKSSRDGHRRSHSCDTDRSFTSSRETMTAMTGNEFDNYDQNNSHDHGHGHDNGNPADNVAVELDPASGNNDNDGNTTNTLINPRPVIITAVPLARAHSTASAFPISRSAAAAAPLARPHSSASMISAPGLGATVAPPTRVLSSATMTSFNTTGTLSRETSSASLDESSSDSGSSSSSSGSSDAPSTVVPAPANPENVQSRIPTIRFSIDFGHYVLQKYHDLDKKWQHELNTHSKNPRTTQSDKRAFARDMNSSSTGHIFLQMQLIEHLLNMWAMRVKVGTEANARDAISAGTDLWKYSFDNAKRHQERKRTLPVFPTSSSPYAPDTEEELMLRERTNALIKVLGYELFYSGLLPYFQARAGTGIDIIKTSSRRMCLLTMIRYGNDTVKTLLCPGTDQEDFPAYVGVLPVDTADKIVDRIIDKTHALEAMLWRSHQLMNRLIATEASIPEIHQRTKEEWASYIMHRLEYLALTLYVAWTRDRLDDEEETAESARQTIESADFTAEDINHSHTGGVFLAEVAINIAEKIEAFDGPYQSACKWYQLALSCLVDVPCPIEHRDAAQHMKKTTLLSLARALALSRNEDDLEEAGQYLETCANEFETDIYVAFTVLEIVSVARPSAIHISLNNLVQIIGDMDMNSVTVKSVLGNVNKMKATPTIHRLSLLDSVFERLVSSECDAKVTRLIFLKRIMLTLCREDDTTEGAEEIRLDLQQYIDNVYATMKEPLAEEEIDVIFLWLWKPVEVMFERELYESVEKWCRLLMHQMFGTVRAVNQAKVYRMLLECRWRRSNKEPEQEAPAAEKSKLSALAEIKEHWHQFRKNLKGKRKHRSSADYSGFGAFTTRETFSVEDPFVKAARDYQSNDKTTDLENKRANRLSCAASIGRRNSTMMTIHEGNENENENEDGAGAGEANGQMNKYTFGFASPSSSVLDVGSSSSAAIAAVAAEAAEEEEEEDSSARVRFNVDANVNNSGAEAQGSSNSSQCEQSVRAMMGTFLDDDEDLNIYEDENDEVYMESLRQRGQGSRTWTGPREAEESDSIDEPY